MATAGSIVIDLLMRTGSFETDSKRAEKRLKQFKKEAEEAGKAIGVAVVAAGTAITALVKTSIDTMDELSKAAQRSNTTTEQFSKLAYGAGLADVSIQDLQGSLGKLAKAQGDALDAGSELWDLPNAVITPHNSFVGDGNRARLFSLIINNLK